MLRISQLRDPYAGSPKASDAAVYDILQPWPCVELNPSVNEASTVEAEHASAELQLQQRIATSEAQAVEASLRVALACSRGLYSQG